MTFPDETMFLDIETTGLSRYYHSVTLVGWALGGQYGVHFAHDPSEEFLRAVKAAKALVTFNGSHFDLPFLRALFAGVEFPQAHVDLRYAARRIGLKGSQKEVETLIGLRRLSSVAGLEGSAAPVLWAQYQRGETKALRRLLEYNYSDIDGMRRILRVVAAKALQSCGFPAAHRRIVAAKWPRAVFRMTTASAPSDAAAIKLTRYVGPVGPKVTLANLQDRGLTGACRVVGIDLTGSESRHSGWAALHGRDVLTARIATDAELMERTLAEHPSLVSIDAPLTLPRGRLKVTDDDPTRSTYGITRQCERVLKHRGVNVYPCLIRSMQGLTERGMRLAARFRSIGVPVIESFPGAMQDILGIPRKRDSTAWLRQGLVEYGLRGPFETGPITHDELDAMSSGVVGQMAWVHQVEALGNEQEGYLIIPNVNSDRDSAALRVVGLSGRTASGKTTAINLLSKRGFKSVSFSETLTEVVGAPRGSLNRAELQRLGTQVRRKRGQRWLEERVAERIGSTGHYAIDGLRFPDDHAFFGERFGSSFTNVFIEADVGIRRRRFLKRGASAMEFVEAETSAMEAHITRISELAHIVLKNEGSLAAFERDLESILESILPLSTS